MTYASNSNVTTVLIAVLAMVGVVLTGCDGGPSVSQPGDQANASADAPAMTKDFPIDVSGKGVVAINGDIQNDRTLDTTNVYVLEHIVEVTNGATLTIEPGVAIFGDTDKRPAALVVREGSSIEASGTEDLPIVFTSANTHPDGSFKNAYGDGASASPAAGDWGGIVILGDGECNGASDPNASGGEDCEVEGIDNSLNGISESVIDWGGSNNADDSGALQYVRIEYAGFDLGSAAGQENSGNELNILTLYGVGSGTEIDHIHVKEGLDDGVELFGGGVDLKYIVATKIGDDSFDYSYGWQGRAQFIIAQQDDSDRGFEVDGNETEGSGDPPADTTDYDFTPLTNPQIYNATLVGDGDSDIGLLYRRGAASTLRNVLVANFGTGLDVQDSATEDRCDDGDLSIDYVTFDNNNFSVGTPISAGTPSSCTGSNVSSGDTDLPMSATNMSNPDFTPSAFGAISGATPPNDGFFDTSADFQGAVVPGTSTPFYEAGTWVEF